MPQANRPRAKIRAGRDQISVHLQLNWRLLPNEIGLLSEIASDGMATMLFSRARDCLFAGSIVLSFSMLFVVQDAGAQAAKQVLTPFGYRNSANVHRVPEGYELISMPDTHIRMHNPTTGDHVDFPKPLIAQEQTPIFSENGWITFASWYNYARSPIAYFVTDWNVPPPPSSYTGQTLFLFNSIEPARGKAILQPVLQYGPSAAGGGEWWAITSWYVVGNQAYYAGIYDVTPGTFLGGQIRLLGHHNNHYSYSADFYGYRGTTLKVTGIPKLVWATETLEVYGVTACSEFPNTAYSQMSAIQMFLQDGTVPSVSWSINNVNTDCNAQTTIVVDSANQGIVDIYY